MATLDFPSLGEQLNGFCAPARPAGYGIGGGNYGCENIGMTINLKSLC